jgi:lysophospholipase L1-like esterase
VKAGTRAAVSLCVLAAFLPEALSAGTVPPRPLKVLLVGDSLSVGPFGRALEEALLARYGRNGVALFASCGSSPEDWLPGRPVFVTNCGYRRSTPSGEVALEYRDGRRPPPANTPKLPGILGRYRPELVLVQLGTNWMDHLAATPASDGRPYRKIIRDFIRELRRGPGPGPVIIWILPPASSKYPLRVHEDVEYWIRAEAVALGFGTIGSRALTAPYVERRTGGDGVHYSEAAGRRWARRVMLSLGAGATSLPLAPGPGAR